MMLEGRRSTGCQGRMINAKILEAKKVAHFAFRATIYRMQKGCRIRTLVGGNGRDVLASGGSGLNGWIAAVVNFGCCTHGSSLAGD